MSAAADGRLSVGFLTTSLSSQDGWGRYSKSLVESVSALADTRTLIQKRALNESAAPRVSAVLPPPRFSLLTQLQVCGACLQGLRDVEVIHALVESYAPGAALASLIMRKTFVMTLHGTYSVPPSRWSMHRFLLRFAYKVAAHTTTGSFGTEQKVKAAGVVLAGCRFIPNGVDEKIFHFDQVPREDFFMTVGEIKPRKGADLGVKALALLAEEFPALTYKIVGSYKENPFVDTIRALAKEAGVSDRVVFTGRIDDRELVSLYNRCRAFVLAARDAAGSFEGFPMVYYEANRCGAPVITTTGFGSEYAIKPGVNGFLVDPEDAPAIADALRRILTDKNLAQQLTQGALNESGKHTWGQLAPSIVAFYNDAKAGITT